MAQNMIDGNFDDQKYLSSLEFTLDIAISFILQNGFTTYLTTASQTLHHNWKNYASTISTIKSVLFPV